MKPDIVFVYIITLFMCACQNNNSGSYLITDIKYSDSSMSQEEIDKEINYLLKNYLGSIFKIEEYDNIISIKNSHDGTPILFKKTTNNIYVMNNDDDMICEIKNDLLRLTNVVSGEIWEYTLRKTK